MDVMSFLHHLFFFFKVGRLFLTSPVLLSSYLILRFSNLVCLLIDNFGGTCCCSLLPDAPIRNELEQRDGLGNVNSPQLGHS